VCVCACVSLFLSMDVFLGLYMCGYLCVCLYVCVCPHTCENFYLWVSVCLCMFKLYNLGLISGTQGCNRQPKLVIRWPLITTFIAKQACAYIHTLPVFHSVSVCGCVSLLISLSHTYTHSHTFTHFHTLPQYLYIY